MPKCCFVNLGGETGIVCTDLLGEAGVAGKVVKTRLREGRAHDKPCIAVRVHHHLGLVTCRARSILRLARLHSPPPTLLSVILEVTSKPSCYWYSWRNSEPCWCIHIVLIRSLQLWSLLAIVSRVITLSRRNHMTQIANLKFTAFSDAL